MLIVTGGKFHLKMGEQNQFSYYISRMLATHQHKHNNKHPVAVVNIIINKLGIDSNFNLASFVQKINKTLNRSVRIEG